MQKGETKALLCTDVNRSSHGPGPPTCYLQTPWATGSHALQLCNECALGLPRSRRAARGSLLVLFFFFPSNIPIFAARTPGRHPAPEVAAWWAVGSGSGSGSCSPRKVTRSRKTRAAVGGRGRVPGGAGRGRAAGRRPPRTHAHAPRGAPAPVPSPRRLGRQESSRHPNRS